MPYTGETKKLLNDIQGEFIGIFNYIIMVRNMSNKNCNIYYILYLFWMVTLKGGHDIFCYKGWWMIQNNANAMYVRVSPGLGLTGTL